MDRFGVYVDEGTSHIAPMTTPPPNRLAQLIERRISIERLRPYRVAVGGDLEQALALYEWNSSVAASFFEVLGHFEVLLRNALHEQLTIWHAARGGPDAWYQDRAGLLDEHSREDIAKAREKLRRRQETEVPGKILAELGFGFWRYLLDKRYETTLWAQALRHSFPALIPQRRRDVYIPVSELTRLRNRIAHHEPIHALDLHGHHDELLRVTGFLDPDMETWLAALSRVPTLLTARP
jgi:hypothetical protein